MKAKAGVAAAVVLGIAAGFALRARPVEGGDPPVELLERIRKGFKKIDLTSVNGLVADTERQSEADLQDDLTELERLHGFEMKKWREMQRERWRFHAILQPEVRAAYAYLTIASIGEERKERLARLEGQENAEYTARYGGSTKPEEARANFESWQKTPEYKKYREEEAAVGTWYRRVIDDEVRKARTGETKAGNLVDELEAECKREMGALATARVKVEKEVRRRKGEPEPEDKPAEPAMDDGPQDPEPGEYDPTREALRLAPIRTQYEGEAGVPVEFLFQVWHGAKPYVYVGMSPRSMEGQYMGTMEEPGQGSFMLTFGKPGTFPVTLMVSDGQKGSKSISYSVKVTGKPVPAGDPEIDKAVAKGKGGGGGDPAAPSNAPVPFRGTFKAMLWNGSVGLPRPDETPKAGDSEILTPVSFGVTIDGVGGIHGNVQYAVPADRFGKPSKPGAYGMFWRSSFDLDGKVDWTTGATHIDLTNGHDESGLELDAKGFGHWKESSAADWTGTLDGWSIPSPAAAAWLRSIPFGPFGATAAVPGSFETIGRPGVTVGPDKVYRFDAKGFFGDVRGAAPAGGGKAWKKTLKKATFTSGYDKNVSTEDQTKFAQMGYDMMAGMGVSGWYLKVLDAPPDPEVVDAEPAAEPQRGDLLGFSIWPVKPMTIEARKPATARAVGVFSEDAYEAVDLSKRATWKASDGISVAPDGTITAAKPGTYTVTATMGTGPNAMSATLTVVVTP